MDKLAIGVDFGTSNTVIAVAGGPGSNPGPARVLNIRSRQGQDRVLPSLLCFKTDDRAPQAAPVSTAGMDAIDDYVRRAGPARLMQSLKSFLGSATFTDTNVFGHSFTLEQLVARLLRHLYEAADAHELLANARMVIGRPIHFAGENPNDNLAQERLVNAFQQSGKAPDAVRTEPEAAAYSFAVSHPGQHRVLVVDLGGGTSDFSVVAVDHRSDGELHLEPLAQTGIGIAGDRLDYAIVQHVVCPALGLGSTFKPEHKPLPVPRWIYANFSSWHQLSHMNQRENLRLLTEILRSATEPTAIEGLLHVIRNDMGFSLFQAVSRVKQALSREEKTRFQFQAGPITIDREVTRDEFEGWIVGDVAQIEATAVRALKTAHIDPHNLTRVFMTGGTSFVPAIRRVFAKKFGAEKLVWGDEFASVAQGLAVMAASV